MPTALDTNNDQEIAEIPQDDTDDVDNVDDLDNDPDYHPDYSDADFTDDPDYFDDEAVEEPAVGKRIGMLKKGGGFVTRDDL